MADSSVWLGFKRLKWLKKLKRLKKRPLESYNKAWLGFIAVAVVAVVIGAMLLVHAVGAGYRHYTAEFLQAASLRPGNPITVAGIPAGTVTSMKLDGDHVEAGLKIRDDVVLGRDSKAVIKDATILGGRYLAVEADGPGRLPHNTFDLTHTEVPYDLQAALKDATTTFEQLDSDRFAQSLTVLGKQMTGLPTVVPQALANIDALSSIIAQRRDQLGQLLKNTERVTNTLRSQQASIGNLVNQGQDLMGVFVARRAVFHAMMQSLQSLVDVLSKIVINDRSGLDALLKDMADFTGLLGQHNDLLRNLLQVSPIFMREAANITGDGNAFTFTIPNGLVVDSWMCAISGRAKQFGMIQYFKDCK
jgi:phospholipid/cholesterol/gamma-HCH transport system substrate-binding protein